MAGMLRKFASAFVVLDESKGNQSEHPELDEMMKDTPSLLAQLDGSAALSASMSAPYAEGETRSKMEMTADQVFQSRKLADGPNAAPRLLKLLAGLSMFPREQQLTMIRAMDAADESWTEQDVLLDASTRHGVLQDHLAAMAAERDTRLAELSARAQQTAAGGQAVLNAIDAEIAALYAKREQEATETAKTVAQIEAERQELMRQEERGRLAIQNVAAALIGLINFFGGSLAPRPPKPGS